MKINKRSYKKIKKKPIKKQEITNYENAFLKECSIFKR